MATEVDKRVVEMQFDNKDFEKNCQASLTTLEKLKMALNFDGAKGLESMGKAASKIDLSNVAKGAEAVQVKFSAMNIAGMTMISELTKGFIGLGKSIWNLTLGQAASGGMSRTLKIDQAMFQIRALAENLDEVKNKTKSVTQVMTEMDQAINAAVTGTAYGYDAAAAVTSQLMASGVTDSEIMEKHLNAIAGAASMTGRSFEDIGNIFTTVASNGRLMTMQLRQFSSAGLNLSATLAKQLGTTEEEINKLVTKGEITFEQFSEALSESFGQAAHRADETWSGVTSNVKAQISRIGQIFTDPFVKRLIPVFASLKTVIKEINSVISPLGKTFDLIFGHLTKNVKEMLDTFDFSRLGFIVRGIENLVVSFAMIADTLRKAFLDVFPKETAQEMIDAAREFEQMTQRMVPLEKTLDGLRALFKAILIPVRLVYNILKALTKSVIKPLAMAALQLLGAFLRLAYAFTPIIDGMVKTLTESKFLETVFLLITASVIVLVNVLKNLVDAFAILFDELFDNIVFEDLIKALQTIAHFIGTVIVTALRMVLNLVITLFSWIQTDTIVNIVKGVGSALAAVVSLILLGIDTIVKTIQAIANSGTVIGNIFSIIKELALLLKDFVMGEDISGHLEKIKTLLGDVGTAVKNAFSIIRDQLKDLDAGKIIVMAFGIAMIFLVWSLHRFVDAATNVANGMAGFFGIFTQIKKILSNFAKTNPIIQVLLGMTILIGMLTASLEALSLIPTGDLQKAVASLVILIGTILVLGVALAVIQKKMGNEFEKSLLNLAVSMIAFAVATVVLAEAVKKLGDYSNINWEASLKPLVVVLGLLAGLSLVVIALSRLMGDKNMFLKQSVFLLALALTIKLLVNTINELTSMDAAQAEVFLKRMIEVIGLIVGLGLAAGLAGASGSSIGGILSLMGFIITVKMLIKLVLSLTEEELKKVEMSILGLTSCLLIPLIAFIGLCAVAVRLSKNQEMIGELSKLIFGFASLMLVAIASIAILGQLKPETLAKGVFATSAVILAIVGATIGIVFAVSMLKGHDYKLAVGALKQFDSLYKAMAVAMIGFAVAAAIVSKVPVDSIETVRNMFIFMSSILAILMYVSKSMQGVSAKPILAMAATIALLMGTLAILSLNSDYKAMAAAGAAIMMALAGLGALMLGMSMFLDSKSTKKVITESKDKSKTKDILSLTAFVGSLSLVLGAVILAVYKFSSMKITDPDHFTTMMVWAFDFLLIMGSFAAGMVLLSRNNDGEGIKAASVLVLTLVAAFAAIAGALMIFSSIKIVDGNSFVALMGSVIILLGTLGLVATLVLLVASNLEEDKIKGAATIIGTFAAIFLAISAVAVILSLIDIKDAAGVIGILGVMAGIIIAIGTFAAIILWISKDIDDIKKVLVSAALIGALATSIFIIAAGVALIVAAVNSRSVDDSNTAGIIAALVAFGVIVGAMVALAIVIIKTKDMDVSRVFAAAGAFAILGATITIIGATIAIIANMTISENAMTTIKLLTAIIGAVVILFAGLVIFSKRINAKNLLLSAAAFAILGGTVSLIVGVLAALVKITSLASPEQMEQVNKTLIIAFSAFGILVAIGTILGALLGAGVGAPIIVGILALAAAFGAFSLSVLAIATAAKLFADAIDTIVNCILKFNNIEVDGDKIKDNLTEAIDAVVEIIPNLIDGFATFLTEAIAALGRLIGDVAMLGIQFVSSFLEGVNSCLPNILDTFLNIMKTVGDYLSKEENVQIIENFATVLGNVIVRVIKGLLGGRWEDINEKLDEVKDKYFAQKNAEASRETAAKQREARMGRLLADYDPLGHGDAEGYDELAKYLYDENGKILNLYDSLSAQQIEALGKHVERAGTEQRKIYEELLGQMTMDVTLSDKTGNSIEEIRTAYAGLAQILGLSEELQNNLTNAVGRTYVAYDEAGNIIGIRERDTNEMLEAQTEGLGDVAEAIDDVKDSATGAADAMGEAGEKASDTWETVKQSAGGVRGVYDKFIEGSKEIFGGSGITETLKDAAEKGIPTVKEKFKQIGEMAGEKFGVSFDASVLENIDYQEIMPSILDGSFDMGDLMGMVMGKQEARAEMKAYEEEKAKYMQEGMEKIITNEGLYNHSGGLSGFEYKWQTVKDASGNQKYRSAEEYAEAIYNDKHALDAAGQAAENYFGILEDGTETTEDGTEATSKFVDGIGDVSEATVKAAKKFGEFYNGLKDSMTNALKNIYDEVKEEDPIGTEEMLKRMEENTKRIGKWARQLRELAAKGMSEGLLNELKDMGPQAADKVDAFARMTSDQLERANQMFAAKSKLPEYATDEIVDSYKEAGFYSSLGFAEGVDPTVVETAFRQLGMEGLEALEKELGIESPSKKTMADGVYATEGLAKGLTNVVALGLLKTSVAKVADALLNNLKIKLDPKLASKIGYDFIVGLANGFNNATSIRNITDRVSGIANGIIDKFRHTWDEHSPSRKAEELGLFFMRGLGVGLEDGSTYLERQTGEKADDILQSMKDKLYGSLMNVTDEGVYEPVIRPVFDLSALDEGWNYINSWFAEGRTISLAGNIQRLTPTTKENNDVLDREILDAVRNLDVDGVRNELNGIRTDISELQAAVTNLQVVMDTGALVGQLVNPMDNALGAKALFNGRGRY